ncbi:MAG: HAD family hydrolase [Candidatus Gracilibacteria bacterium]|nr:HAD family hydrolase [Candidatus Gracilibacteria bacterium]
MKKKYIIFDLDGTLIQSNNQIDSIIYEYIKESIDENLLDHARYLIEHNQGISIFELIKILTDNSPHTQKYTDEITGKINKLENTINFFPGVPELIQELSQTYTLFLSTGNSDDFANNILGKGGIRNCFEKILGSSYILKSPEHIQIFIDHMNDDHFSENSIFVGDGDRDREIADYYNMDFVHIGDDKKDLYEINRTTDIRNILSIIENKGNNIKINY